jgi:MYXO-CTERM domain-containing protein
MSRTQRAAPRRSLLRALAVVVAGAAAASAALLVGSEAPVQAATPLTLATMTIDGSFGDWTPVLANVNQATRDGDGSSYAQALCAQFSGDRDCSLAGGSGNDFLTFAWTYDESNVYLYVERYGSPSNGVDLLFVADVNGDKLLTSSDRVVHARWNGTTGAVALDWSPYAPANAAGDSIVCAPVAPETLCANPAGVLAAPAGYVDGYKLPGTNPGTNTCTGCAGLGNTTGNDPLKGLQVEVAIPWSAFGVSAPRPFYWHTVSSNNRSLASAVDNIGAPNGRLGSFFYRAVSLTPDRHGVVTSPGAVEYPHVLANGGNAADTFDLVATSTAGAGVELLLDGVVIGRDDEGDGTWEYASDSNANGLPDVTVELGASRALTVRIVMPAGRRGEDVTRVTARSAGDLLVSATVTDTSVVGSPALLPPAQSKGTVAGQAAPFALQLVNSEPVVDTFDLAVDGGCPGALVELRADADGAPGAVLATDGDGDGAWDSVPGDTTSDGNPDVVDVAPGGTRVGLWLEITPPADAVAGESCTVRLTARSVYSGATDYADQTVTVGPAVSFTPSYTFAAGTSRVVPPGGRVYFPGVIENNEPVARAYALSIGARVPATLATSVVWTDPDGDGNPSDGVVATTTGMVPAYGGRVNVVVELVAETSTGDDLAVGTAVTVPVIATPTAGGAPAATQLDEARVGYLATFGDPLLTNSARAFAPCDTVVARASSLEISDVLRYALTWRDASGQVARAVAPWGTTARGTAEDSFTLPAGATPGTWTLVLEDGGVTLEALTFEVERSGEFLTLATDRARVAPGTPLAVSATIRSTQQRAPLSGTALRYVVEDVAQTAYMDLSGAFHPGPGTTRTAPLAALLPGASRSDGFSVAAASYPAPGVYQVRAEWQLACGGDPLVASALSAFEVPPPPPAITSPSPGALVGTRQPTVTGTAHPGATVRLREGPATFGPVVAGVDGTFAHTLSAGEALADGPHALTATQSFGGVASEESAAVAFTVDATAPAAPALDPISTPTRAEPVPVSGSAEANGVVTLVLDGAVVGTVTASGAGTFSTTLAGVGELPAPHALHATVRDAAGNVSPPSASVAFTVDRTPPAPPALDAIASPTRADPVPVTGTAEAESTVSLLLDGAPAGTVTATGGAFATALDAVGELPAPHALEATATDAAGNESGAATATFVVDRTLPGPPLLPPVDSPTRADPVVVTGTAEPGADVLVSVDGAVVTTAAADAATGAFSAPLEGLADGTRLFSAEARDAAGNVGPPSLTLSFVLDRTPPAAPQIATPATGAFLATGSVVVGGTAEAGAAVTVTVGSVSGATTASGEGAWSVALALADGAHTASVAATDLAGNASAAATRAFTVDTAAPAAPVVAAPAAGAFVASDVVAFAGSAEAGATVRVGVGVLSTTTTAGADGTFLATLALADGAHTALVTAQDAAGNVSEASSRSFTVDTLAPAAPLVDAPVEGALLATASVTFGGSAEPGALVVVTAGAASASGVADGEGAWSATLAPGEGTFTASVVATDAAGNASIPALRGFTIDTTPPLAPTFSAPAGGAALASWSVTFAGSAEAAALVTVTVGAVSGTATAGGDGAWTVALSLPDGSHTATATTEDALGRVSPPASLAFDVDTAAPAAPTITAPAAGALLASGSVLFGGTAEAGATVTVTVGAVSGSAVAADGSWSLALGLPDGAQSATVVATDAAGNVSLEATRSFGVDTAAPPAPSFLAPGAGATVAPGAVEVRGTAEAGALVTVTVAGTTATAEAGSDGAWSVELVLPEGAHGITATATDGAGNVSPASEVSVVAWADDGAGGGGGCGCRTGAGGGAPALLALAGLLALAPRTRRRRDA